MYEKSLDSPNPLSFSIVGSPNSKRRFAGARQSCSNCVMTAWHKHMPRNKGGNKREKDKHCRVIATMPAAVHYSYDPFSARSLFAV
jgi:hypothetical protein